MTPLKYLKQELGFDAKEWIALDDDTKDWYRNAAREEMEVMGIKMV